MGNSTSCCYLKRSNSKTAKLFDPNGNLRKVEIPITAAEIMLEEPGYFVSPVDDLRRTCRIRAMNADGELLGGKLYLLVPVSRVNCVLSALESALVESICGGERRLLKRGSSKVLPAAPNAPVVVLSGPDTDTGSISHRLRSQRQWKPVLEPIYEACE